MRVATLLRLACPVAPQRISRIMRLSQNSHSRWGRRSTIPLDHLPAIVGRDPDCDIRLRDPSVSGLHCEINQINGRLVILDLESSHGTFVNGCRVRFAHVVTGDTLRWGRTRLVVEDGGRTLRVMPSREGIMASVFPPTTSDGGQFSSS
jgi:pSer/pThr/pTyr-binding forkhead associated (FHA) protein